MDPPAGLRKIFNPTADEIGMRSDPGLDHKASMRSKTSKRQTGLVQKNRRDASVMSINTTAASSLRPEEELNSPLRLALARRSVKKAIFKYMDQGDKKTDIESRTGLSHQCIKWHRQLWRTECSHPRPRSKKSSQSLSLRSQSPSTRNEQPSKKRPACEAKDDFSSANERSSGKRRRKHRAVKQSMGRPVCAATEKPQSEGGKCTETERKGSVCLMGKENLPAKDEALMVSVLPIRDRGP